MGKAASQSVAGITNQRDTSFTRYSAYLSTKKNYPDIKIVEEIHSSSVKEKRNITYDKLSLTTGERKLLLDVFYPGQKSKIPRTAILIIHGGGWRSGDKTLHHPLAQRLASLGYVCFTPEYRLSTEALYPAAVNDIKAALRWINRNARKYNIDVAKIVVAGHSAGGELAAFIGTTNDTKYSSHVDAVIDIDGLLAFIHPESGEGDDSKRVSAATNWFGYSKNENPDLWKQASPLTYAGKNTPPTLFINSDVTRMHAGREDYIKILTANNIYTEVRHFENSPHSFCLFDPWFEPTVKLMDDFLKKVFAK
jgi:pectinesterase